MFLLRFFRKKQDGRCLCTCTSWAGAAAIGGAEGFLCVNPPVFLGVSPLLCQRTQRNDYSLGKEYIILLAPPFLALLGFLFTVDGLLEDSMAPVFLFNVIYTHIYVLYIYKYIFLCVYIYLFLPFHGLIKWPLYGLSSRIYPAHLHLSSIIYICLNSKLQASVSVMVSVAD